MLDLLAKTSRCAAHCLRGAWKRLSASPKSAGRRPGIPAIPDRGAGRTRRVAGPDGARETVRDRPGVRRALARPGTHGTALCPRHPQLVTASRAPGRYAASAIWLGRDDPELVAAPPRRNTSTRRQQAAGRGCRFMAATRLFTVLISGHSAWCDRRGSHPTGQWQYASGR